jgi:hypothetical protein
MACAARNAIIGAGIVSLDVSVDKKFHVTEGKYFESRREFFNIDSRQIQSTTFGAARTWTKVRIPGIC